MTLEQAEFHLESPESERIGHIVTHQDGPYSIASHGNLEVCDYCVEDACGITEHLAKPNIYEMTKVI